MPNTPEPSVIEIDLKRPGVAALLGWLIPGAGHIYQRRYGKGILFMVCILATYFFGLTLGDGHVVYASFRKDDVRWQYICQLGVGAAALPAVIQSQRVKNHKEPLFDGYMAPPPDVDPSNRDTLAEWHLQLKWKFELATLYTMIAGLLNILAVYDAFAGPLVPTPPEAKPPADKQKPKTS